MWNFLHFENGHFDSEAFWMSCAWVEVLFKILSSKIDVDSRLLFFAYVCLLSGVVVSFLMTLLYHNHNLSPSLETYCDSFVWRKLVTLPRTSSRQSVNAEKVRYTSFRVKCETWRVFKSFFKRCFHQQFFMAIFDCDAILGLMASEPDSLTVRTAHIL